MGRVFLEQLVAELDGFLGPLLRHQHPDLGHQDLGEIAGRGIAVADGLEQAAAGPRLPAGLEPQGFQQGLVAAQLVERHFGFPFGQFGGGLVERLLVEQAADGRGIAALPDGFGFPGRILRLVGLRPDAAALLVHDLRRLGEFLGLAIELHRRGLVFRQPLDIALADQGPADLFRRFGHFAHPRRRLARRRQIGILPQPGADPLGLPEELPFDHLVGGGKLLDPGQGRGGTGTIKQGLDEHQLETAPQRIGQSLDRLGVMGKQGFQQIAAPFELQQGQQGFPVFAGPDGRRFSAIGLGLAHGAEGGEKGIALGWIPGAPGRRRRPDGQGPHAPALLVAGGGHQSHRAACLASLQPAAGRSGELAGILFLELAFGGHPPEIPDAGGAGRRPGRLRRHLKQQQWLVAIPEIAEGRRGAVDLRGRPAALTLDDLQPGTAGTRQLLVGDRGRKDIFRSAAPPQAVGLAVAIAIEIQVVEAVPGSCGERDLFAKLSLGAILPAMADPGNERIAVDAHFGTIIGDGGKEDIGRLFKPEPAGVPATVLVIRAQRVFAVPDLGDRPHYRVASGRPFGSHGRGILQLYLGQIAGIEQQAGMQTGLLGACRHRLGRHQVDPGTAAFFRRRENDSHAFARIVPDEEVFQLAAFAVIDFRGRPGCSQQAAIR